MGRASLRRLFVLAALLSPTAAHAQSDDARTLPWQGVERHYTLHRPKPETPGAVPLVVALAGLTQNLASLRAWLPIDPIADVHGFAVAYPQAIGFRWSYWQGGRVMLPDHDAEEVDDTGFIAAVVEALVSGGIADPARVYVTGISRGALMTWTLACDRADLFAAAAPISSAMTARQEAGCHPSRPMPIIAVDGTEDPIQPYDGFLFAPPVPELISVPESMRFWWRLHGCTSETVKPMRHLNSADATRTRVYDWTSCATAGPIRLYRVIVGGHAPPTMTASDPPAQAMFGRRGSDFETAEEIWAGFAESAPLPRR